MRIFLVFLFSVLLSGCGKFDVTTLPAPELINASQVCIVKNSQTKEGFRQAIASWLTEEGISYRDLEPEANVDNCEWTVKYYGRWSWDVALFLSDAEIVAYRDGEQEGLVKLRVGQWDAYKFENGTKRIHKMLDLLSGKSSKYELPVKSK